MRELIRIGIFSLCFGALPALAQTVAPVATNKFWSSYVYEKEGKKVCFVSAEPAEKLPKNVNRGQVIFYISHWPKQNVRNEISIKIGYPFKQKSKPVAQIGSDKFTMFVKDDKAFIANPQTETKLVEAMKRGDVLIVKGLSQRGTLTTDTYSLAGITAALKKIEEDCP